MGQKGKESLKNTIFEKNVNFYFFHIILKPDSGFVPGHPGVCPEIFGAALVPGQRDILSHGNSTAHSQ